METIIKTERMCKSYFAGKNEIQVIKDMDIEIYKEDFTVIMGSSGSGKSTLLYSISTMDEPTSGRVELLGEDISKLNEKQINRIRSNSIAFVFQSFNLLNDITVQENIQYCGYLVNNDKKSVNEQVRKLLDKLHLSEQAEKYPNELSGGQQQRIALARALVNSPEILFGDEPTGALNSSSGNDVLNLLTELNRNGQSIVMVTHDIKAAVRANRLIYLRDGTIDGDYKMFPYSEDKKEERERDVFEYLKTKGW